MINPRIADWEPTRTSLVQMQILTETSRWSLSTWQKLANPLLMSHCRNETSPALLLVTQNTPHLTEEAVDQNCVLKRNNLLGPLELVLHTLYMHHIN